MDDGSLMHRKSGCPKTSANFYATTIAHKFMRRGATLFFQEYYFPDDLVADPVYVTGTITVLFFHQQIWYSFDIFVLQNDPT